MNPAPAGRNTIAAPALVFIDAGMTNSADVAKPAGTGLVSQSTRNVLLVRDGTKNLALAWENVALFTARKVFGSIPGAAVVNGNSLVTRNVHGANTWIVPPASA